MEVTRIEHTVKVAKRKYPHHEYTFQAKLSNGRCARLKREVVFRPNSAAILPYNPICDHVLLTRQLRFPSYVSTGFSGGEIIEVPSGGIEAETPVACAIREAREEVGIRVDRCSHILTIYPAPAILTEKVYCFIGEYRCRDTSASRLVHHDEEDVEVLELPLDEAMTMINSGAIVDCKTILLLRHLTCCLTSNAQRILCQLE